MDKVSLDYFRRREAHALQLASAAVDPAIAAIHRELADKYRQQLAQASASTTG